MTLHFARIRTVLLGTLAACAFTASPAAADQLVVGGHDTSTAEWPSAVFLDGLAYSCTGTLIDPQWVLTAAHCVALTVPAGPVFPAVHLTATVGADAPYGSGGRSAQVLLAYTHPNYSLGNDYDVALLQLATPLDGVPTIKTVGADEDALWTAGTSSTIIGWGDVAEGGPGADVIQEAQVPIVDDTTCGQKVSGFNAAVMLCAGFIGVGGVDTCQGDSGGPLFVPTAGGGWRQAGITSFGNGCARPNDPGVYTRLGGPAIRDFVAQHVPGAVGSGATRPAAAKSAAKKRAAKKRAAKKKSSRKRAKRARAR